MTAIEVEQWYHKWMADHDRAEVATVNVLDMLKDFASQYAHHQPTTKAVLNELIKYFSQQLRLQRESNIQYTGQEAFVDAVDVCKNAYKKKCSQQPVNDGWVRAEDDLPDHETEVDVYNRYHKKVITAKRLSTDKRGVNWSCEYGHYITHWRLRPEPPKK